MDTEPHVDIPRERVEKVKETMRKILKDNDKPLSAVELFNAVRIGLGNGDIVDQETIGVAMEQMLSRHELISVTTGKIAKFKLNSSKPR